MFQRLDDENIRIPESLRYYLYRATFDFECFFDNMRLPSDSPTRTTERNRGVERARARAGAMSPRDSKSFVTRMMKALQYISDAAYEKLKVSYEDK